MLIYTGLSGVRMKNLCYEVCSFSYGSTKFALVRPLTHNLTHTGKEADGDSGADRTESIIFLEQKSPETAEYQRFLVFQAVDKDEVSNSKNPLKSVDFGGFFVVLGTFFAGCC